MGSGRQYRWDRRRKRQASLNRERKFRNFWGFETILLILIFGLWFLLARLVVVYAFSTSPCIEAIAAFGATGADVKTAFDIMMWIVLLLFGYWLAIGAHFWKTLRRSKSGVIHIVLLGAIILLGVNFRMLQVGHNNPPDGSIAIRDMVIDETHDPAKYAPLVIPWDEYGKWVLGPSTQTDQPYGKRYRQHCVWLDENLVRDGGYVSIDGYVSAGFEKKYDLLNSYFSNLGYESLPWPDPKFGELLRSIVAQATDEITASDHLIEHGQYRILLPEERERFIAKQKCLRDNIGKPGLQNKCNHTWVVDYSAYYEQYPIQ